MLGLRESKGSFCLIIDEAISPDSICLMVQGGPLPVISGVITLISRVITPFITSRGPPCKCRKIYQSHGS